MYNCMIYLHFCTVCMEPPRIRINTIGSSLCGKNWRLGPAQTCAWKDFDLWFLTEGTGSVMTPEGEIPLLPGSCLLMRGGQSYDFHRHSHGRFYHYYVHFDYLDAEGRPLPPNRHRPPPLYRHIEDIDFFAGLLKRADREFHSGDPGGKKRAACWIQSALLEIRARDIAPQKSNRDLKSAQIHWIESLCTRIRENPGAPYQVEKIAEDAGYSRSYFTSLFREVTGMSPRDYILRSRLRAAEHLLLDTDYSISGIAQILGYRDVFFFSRQFKLYHGASPMHYRKENRRIEKIPLSENP